MDVLYPPPQTSSTTFVNKFGEVGVLFYIKCGEKPFLHTVGVVQGIKLDKSGEKKLVCTFDIAISNVNVNV